MLLRVPRGAPAPDDAAIRRAIEVDRRRLNLPAADGTGYRFAGPYRIDLDGQSLDEYVAWEV